MHVGFMFERLLYWDFFSYYHSQQCNATKNPLTFVCCTHYYTQGITAFGLIGNVCKRSYMYIIMIIIIRMSPFVSIWGPNIMKPNQSAQNIGHDEWYTFLVITTTLCNKSINICWLLCRSSDKTTEKLSSHSLTDKKQACTSHYLVICIHNDIDLQHLRLKSIPWKLSL